MVAKVQELILLVDDNAIVCNALADRFRAANFEVIATASGEAGFRALRDWSRKVDWLYVRANLPGLVDGWILADEYHDLHPDRSVVISSGEARLSQRNEIILRQPTPNAVFEEIQHLAEWNRAKHPKDQTDTRERQRAA
jgi:DNA-binding NtrC family response regulator